MTLTRRDLRDGLAAVSRALPAVRGKGRIAMVLQDWLTDYGDPGDCIVTCRLCDESLMTLDLRSYTEKHAFWSGLYDTQQIALAKSLVPPGGLVADVGANVGFWAVPLGRLAERIGGSVFAFEPVPQNHQRLLQNVFQNGLDGIVRAQRLALGRGEGVVRLKIDGVDPGCTGNAFVTDETTDAVHEARLCTLDQVAARSSWPRLDFLKADIEGGELDLIVGAMSLLRRFRPALVVELNHYWMERRGWSEVDILQTLRPLGYRAFTLAGRALIPREAHGSEAGIESLWLIPVDGPAEAVLRESGWIHSRQ